MKGNNFVSYFTTSTVIGILTNGKDASEAQEKALEKLESDDGINHCLFEQTPIVPVFTEEWDIGGDTDIIAAAVSKDPSVQVNLGPKVKNVIATRLHKKASALTNEDYVEFVKEAIESNLVEA